LLIFSGNFLADIYDYEIKPTRTEDLETQPEGEERDVSGLDERYDSMATRRTESPQGNYSNIHGLMVSDLILVAALSLKDMIEEF
jgi:hypothetical protein